MAKMGIGSCYLNMRWLGLLVLSLTVVASLVTAGINTPIVLVNASGKPLAEGATVLIVPFLAKQDQSLRPRDTDPPELTDDAKAWAGKMKQANDNAVSLNQQVIGTIGKNGVFQIFEHEKLQNSSGYEACRRLPVPSNPWHPSPRHQKPLC